MSAPTTSPTPIVNNSSTEFANAPIVNLLQKPLHLMSQDELRAYTLELRTLQKSPQALGRRLRQEAEEKETKSASKKSNAGSNVPPVKKQSLEDMMKDMGM
jgi:hypothetical protein